MLRVFPIYPTTLTEKIKRVIYNHSLVLKMLTLMTTFTVILLTAFIRVGGFRIIYNDLMIGWLKLHQMYLLGKTIGFTVILRTAWGVLRLMLSTLWLQTCQKLNSTVRKVGKHTYEIRYSIHGKEYRMIQNTHAVPHSEDFIMVFDHNNQLLTEMVKQFAGPANDFHGRDFTPDFFGAKRLVFEMADGRSLSFDRDEVIDFDEARGESSACEKSNACEPTLPQVELHPTCC